MCVAVRPKYSSASSSRARVGTPGAISPYLCQGTFRALPRNSPDQFCAFVWDPPERDAGVTVAFFQLRPTATYGVVTASLLHTCREALPRTVHAAGSRSPFPSVSVPWCVTSFSPKRPVAENRWPFFLQVSCECEIRSTSTQCSKLSAALQSSS